MVVTDPIADYLTRLRNAISAKHKVVEIPASNLKKEMTKILDHASNIAGVKKIINLIIEKNDPKRKK